MRSISYEQLIKTVSELIVDINYRISDKIRRYIEMAFEKEKNKLGKNYLKIILENLKIAEKEKIPICQDTGLPIVFIEKGEEVVVETGKYKTIEEIINSGIEEGSKKGYLRNSVVSPIERKNTGINSPGVVHIVPGKKDKFKITVIAKGFGSENMCKLKMLKPSEGVKGIEDFVIESVKSANGFPCPPVFVGIGIGGSFEKSAILSKLALCNIGKKSKYRKLEEKILKKINSLGIGPGGLGGKITALDVRIETYPTHIAGLPVAVSISCWAHRIKSVEL